MMQQPTQADFHHGWLIEVVAHERGFQSLCYSPCRKRLVDATVYTSAAEALESGRLQVSYHVACISIVHWIRDLYEQHKLTIDEWQSLSQSIVQMAIE
ncbi:MAG: hypothetical protein F6K28_34980 [Microcoleus sp. SIO2G3]|nr:hypothetical protein [Microcoleus sp. SIO2G3]